MIEDIYFDERYGKLYEKSENGQNIVFKLETNDGKITNQFLKRKIPIKISEKEYYDIVTPYGYGGPIINLCNGNKKQLLIDYEKSFKEFCINNNIVSEFVRFHPIISNAMDFKDIYNSECIRKTLGTNLKEYEDPVSQEFSKSCRKNIRQALNKGITFKITENPDNISNFKEIYYSTMDRNAASEYYYFDNEYFSNLLKYFGEHLLMAEAIFEDKPIAAGLYFIYNKMIHIHLSGTLSEYLYLSPAYILRYAVTLWGKSNGYDLIHHGGGRSNSPDDSLYKFKKSFAKNTEFDFYIGKKVWNEDIFNKLCKLKDVDENEDFFPPYRKT